MTRRALPGVLLAAAGGRRLVPAVASNDEWVAGVDVAPAGVGDWTVVTLRDAGGGFRTTPICASWIVRDELGALREAAADVRARPGGD